MREAIATVPRLMDEASNNLQQAARERARAANLAHAALSLPPKRWSGATILVLSFVAFLVVTSRDTSLSDLAVLVAVLLFHEAGHLIGMKLFGFSDLRMFFLP